MFFLYNYIISSYKTHVTHTYMWVNYNDLTVLPNPGIMVYVREIIPFYGRTIQVSLKYYIIHPDIYTYIYTHKYYSLPRFTQKSSM